MNRWEASIIIWEDFVTIYNIIKHQLTESREERSKYAILHRI